MSPSTAKHARLLRLATKLSRVPPAAQGSGALPRTDGERMMWVNSHVQLQRDRALSREEERLRGPLMPLEVKNNAMMTGTPSSGENLFHFRDFPMFPGEVVPAGHNTLSSVRADLSTDLTVQSLKDAWFRVAGGMSFMSVSDYYKRADGLDEVQLGEVIAALFPTLSKEEARGLVRRVLEAISRPNTTPARQLSSRISSAALGLDNSPGHYTNFLEWMARMMDTKAFQTEHAIFQFARRKFNRGDVRAMYENYHLLSSSALAHLQSDGYSHYFEVLKDFARKVAGDDTRHMIGVRIDPPEVDSSTGMAFGLGRQDAFEVVAIVRENRDHTGHIHGNGRTLAELTNDRAWIMEIVLQPFDEANLDYRDFDVYIVNRGTIQPLLGNRRWAMASRMAIGNALAKLMPTTRMWLKKAGILSMDRRRELGDHPGFVNGKNLRRPFFKR